MGALFNRRERAFVVSAGARYFGDDQDAAFAAIGALALPETDAAPSHQLTAVALPGWAADISDAAPEAILIDTSCVVDDDGAPHERCDWLRAAFLHLTGWLERSVEDEAGPIQSYAMRLPKGWRSAYDRAWVNWIFLFLRQWAAREHGVSEETLFGPRPRARFRLTHDVDALEKTVQMRIKSTGMSAIATVRHLLRADIGAATKRIGDALVYAFRSTDYWLFDEVCRAEASRGFRSDFFFADNRAAPGLTAWLMDPSYAVAEPRVTALLRQLAEDGWGVGMHPGFNTWRDEGALGRTKSAVDAALGASIDRCRQHWLRFSWRDTWRAQEAAGVREDFTLCFNDRPGFRNGAALRFAPWEKTAGAPIGLWATPTILMDSHFYDYAFPDDPAAAMTPFIDETIAVGGEAALLWHVHTMHPEVGWGEGYLALLDLLAARGASVIAGCADD